MATQQQQNKTQRKDGTQATLPAQELEAQNRYWRDNFRGESYVADGKEFDAYEPAYRLGAQARCDKPQSTFAEIEGDLRLQYEANQQARQGLDWTQAKQAVRAAWDRTDQSMAGSNKHKAEQQRSRH